MPKLIFCECCKEMKPWSTIYHGLQSRGELWAVCPACKKYLDQKDRVSSWDEIYDLLGGKV